jgi:hypothetical protein
MIVVAWRACRSLASCSRDRPTRVRQILVRSKNRDEDGRHETVDTKNVDTKNVDTKNVDTKNVDTRKIETKKVGRKQEMLLTRSWAPRAMWMRYVS